MRMPNDRKLIEDFVVNQLGFVLYSIPDFWTAVFADDRGLQLRLTYEMRSPGQFCVVGAEFQTADLALIQLTQLDNVSHAEICRLLLAKTLECTLS